MPLVVAFVLGFLAGTGGGGWLEDGESAREEKKHTRGQFITLVINTDTFPLPLRHSQLPGNMMERLACRKLFSVNQSQAH